MKQRNRLLYFLACIKFITPFLLQNSFYEPHRDEFLYLAEGHHMAWGFMEVPPLLSVFAWFTHLLGDGMFWIKFWPSLFGAFNYLIVGGIILSLGGKMFALVLGFLPFVFGFYLRVHFLFQPNFLEIFFWSAISYSIIRYVQTQQNKWLYLAGLSVGLGMMSKYSVAFFAVSIFLGLLLTRQQRVLQNKHLYLAFALAFVIFLPNILWQYWQHFPVFFHMKELQQTQLQYVSPADFLKDQLLMNLPSVFIWLAGLWFVSFSATGKNFRFMGWAYAGVIILLLLGHGKNYYALGVYPPLFAFGAYYLEQLTAQRFSAWRYVFVIIPVIIGLIFIPIALPVLPPPQLEAYYVKNHLDKTGALKWEDLENHPLPQDFADMLGWEEMAQKTATSYHSMNAADQQRTIIFCDNYGMAGAVNFYRKKYGLPEAYSDNASFLYWMPQPITVVNVILITGDKNEMQHAFIKDFNEAILSDSITNPYAREKGSFIITLKGANAAFNKMFSEKIKKDEAELN